MTNTQTIATHKIIFFVVFVCAALMASLFIYHSTHKNKSTQPLAPEIGMIFPVPKDIKSFELVTMHGQKFTEKDFYQHWTLLFFGFTHCSSVCPNTLGIMDKVYAQLHDQYPDLRVVLVSVDPERDTPASLEKYIQTYNPEFTGVTGKIQDIRKLQSQLGIYSARDSATSSADYQIQHTSSIMLINPQGKWVGLFKYGLKPDELAKGLVTGIGHAAHV